MRSSTSLCYGVAAALVIELLHDCRRMPPRRNEHSRSFSAGGADRHVHVTSGRPLRVVCLAAPTRAAMPMLVRLAIGRRTPTMSHVGGDRPSTDGAGSLSGSGPVLPLDTEAVLVPVDAAEPGASKPGDKSSDVRGRSPG